MVTGIVVLRGFIYGHSFGYNRNNRIAIPAAFFGPYDGEYAQNVHIVGKTTPLDFETAEPINPLDGVLRKTQYGGEVVVGKNFFMSWVKNWENWLGFDNGHGSPHELNRDIVDSMLGVLMIGALLPTPTLSPTGPH